MRIAVQIPDERFTDLLTSAFEGGSNYWAASATIEGEWPAGVRELYPSQVPMAGGAVRIHDAEGGKHYQLDREACERGAHVMAEKYPKHWAAFVAEDDDATTGDVFLQCCLFGDLVYG